MKRVFIVITLAISMCAVWPLAAGAEMNATAQDLVIRSEAETAISMLQAVYTKYQNGEMTLE